MTQERVPVDQRNPLMEFDQGVRQPFTFCLFLVLLDFPTITSFHCAMSFQATAKALDKFQQKSSSSEVVILIPDLKFTCPIMLICFSTLKRTKMTHLRLEKSRQQKAHPHEKLELLMDQLRQQRLDCQQVDHDGVQSRVNERKVKNLKRRRCWLRLLVDDLLLSLRRTWWLGLEEGRLLCLGRRRRARRATRGG